MTVDGMCFLGFVFFLHYIPESLADDFVGYSVEDVILGNAVFLSLSIAAVCMTKALHNSKGGPIQAIENLKIVWQLILTIVIQSSVP